MLEKVGDFEQAVARPHVLALVNRFRHDGAGQRRTHGDGGGGLQSPFSRCGDLLHSGESQFQQALAGSRLVARNPATVTASSPDLIHAPQKRARP